jgi:hypothetical protein
MRIDLYTKVVLTLIAGLLCVLALRPISVQAQNQVGDLYFEPGYTQLRKPDGTASIQGKMAIDFKTGNIWGFPTGVEGPYPVNFTDTKPPTSKPFLLGKFDLTGIK